MWSLVPSRLFGKKIEEVASEAADALLAHDFTAEEESTILRTLGWLTAGLGAVAIGLFVGRELRQRYKFNRRTPYDFYAHAGTDDHDLEYSVGI